MYNMFRIVLPLLISVTLAVASDVKLQIPLKHQPLEPWTGDGAQGDYRSRPELSQSWGQYSPWFEASLAGDIPSGIPAQCTVTFAQVLSRHGDRYPTSHVSEDYRKLIDKIHQKVVSYGDNVAFLKDYNYTLGADQLTAFGQHELMNSGRDFFERYTSLSTNAVPFVRASGQERVIMSARNWTQGFHQAKFGNSEPYSNKLYPILVIREDNTSANPLSNDLCTDFTSRPGAIAKSQYGLTFLSSIQARLNKELAGAHLSPADTVSIMDLCPFNTVATPTGVISPFCDLFTLEEWQKYDYLQSLEKFYGYGAGNVLGPTRGVGFVNELIARLTQKPVMDHTCTNSTLDNSTITFPLKLPLYADFSHDNDITGILFALGLYNSTKPLSKEQRESVDETDGYSAAYTVPFAARAYFEKLSCNDHPNEEMVRVLVNGRVMPLRTCGADELGRCLLSNFTNSLSFAKQGGYWDQCFKKKKDE